MVQYFQRNDCRLTFCEVLYSEAIRRKCESTHQDVAFLEGILLPSAAKKVKPKAVTYTHQDVTFS